MIGEKLLHYEILEPLGEGGMGVVYKARDTHLDRWVAVKVLPPEKVADPTRKARFIQEAKAASALNHANIVHIYDIAAERGIDFIAMEYVAGKTLDELIPRKGLRLGEALKIAIQIASALARAHAAGIVHRDLKPSNVMVDEHGGVKLLDFGLAKLVEQNTSDDAATATMLGRTAEGTVVGTAAYMSPEQAEGKPLDARSDIFAFGAVLYEMLTGFRAFQGTSSMSVLSCVLREEPAPLPADVPYELRRLVERCLRKDPERRLHGMDDVKLALEDLKQESDSGKLSGGGETVIAGRRKTTYVWAALAAGVVLLIFAGLWRFVPRESVKPTAREIPFVTDAGLDMFPVFSPDGTTVAYHVWPEGGVPPEASIRLKMIGMDSTQVLKANARGPAWSPDGKRLAYVTYVKPGSSDADIWVIPRLGSAERKIGTVRLHSPRAHQDQFLRWTRDGKWIASMDQEGDAPYHLVLTSVEGGEKRRLTTPPKGSYGDSGPAFSPDGRTLAFTRHRVWGQSDLHLLTLDANLKPAGEPRLLKTGTSNPTYAVWTAEGREIIFCHRVWHRATLWRVRSDGSGPATPLNFGGRGAYCPDIALVGDLLIYMKHVWDTNIWRVELDASGKAVQKPEKFIASTLLDFGAEWSPDGKSIAFGSERSDTRGIFICDAAGNNPRQITFLDPTWGMEPRWSPDGMWIAFQADGEGNGDIYIVPASGGKHRRLTADPAIERSPWWSPDSRWIYFRSDRGGKWATWKVSVEGGEATAAPEERWHKRGPDGEACFYTEGGALWRKSATGGDTEKVLSGMAIGSFAVSAKGVYFTLRVRDSEKDPWKYEIAFHDFATGQRTKIADLQPGMYSGSSYTVSPDGRWLLYTQCDREGEDDLMLVENFR